MTGGYIICGDFEVTYDASGSTFTIPIDPLISESDKVLLMGRIIAYSNNDNKSYSIYPSQLFPMIALEQKVHVGVVSGVDGETPFIGSMALIGNTINLIPVASLMT